jgi:hypothetical protein
VNRIDRPRFSVRGDVLSTFWPRCFTWFNSRCGHMFLRKWRGLRKRGRAWRNSERAWMLHRSLTSDEIDQIAQATVAKVAKSRVIALDRKATPFTDCMRKAFHL